MKKPDEMFLLGDGDMPPEILSSKEPNVIGRLKKYLRQHSQQLEEKGVLPDYLVDALYAIKENLNT